MILSYLEPQIKQKRMYVNLLIWVIAAYSFSIYASEMEELEEVIVTATKRGEQKLEDVPLAIQSFSTETLSDMQLYELQNLITAIPGAGLTSAISASNKAFSLRGSGAGGAVGDSLIGYYLDDVPFGIPNFQGSPPIRYFDLERVEVLRGPQGTLYGQGSMGGTIVYRTRDPDMTQFTMRGGVKGSWSEDAGDPNSEISGAISVPLIIDKLAFGFSGGYEFRSGYADAYEGAAVGTPFKKDANDIRIADYRGVMLWTPNERLSVRSQIWHFETDQDYLQVMGSLDPPQLVNQTDFASFDISKTDFYSITATYEFDDFTLTNAMGYQDTSPNGFALGLNFGVLGVGFLDIQNQAESFVNEFRINSNTDDPLQWLAGLSYRDANGHFQSRIELPVGSLFLSTDNRTDTESVAVYGQISYEFLDGKFVPLAGLRYYEDWRTGSDAITGLGNDGNPNVVTWNVNLAYYPNDNTTVFFNAGTGFRSGIIQSTAQADFASGALGVSIPSALEPDELTNFELGVRGVLAGGALRLSASVYHLLYDDYQSEFSPLGITVYANFGDAETTGLDLDIVWDTPIEGLALGFIGNVNTSEFKDVAPGFSAAVPTIANGKRLINTPKFNWRADIDYARPIASRWNLFARASIAQTGGVRVFYGTEFETWESYTASFGLENDQYELSFFGDNLADYRGPVTAPNSITLLQGPYPRTFGLRLRIKDFNWD